MFIPTTLYHKSSQSECKSYLSESFSMLCWNVHKNNYNSEFIAYLEEEVRHKKIEIIMFQEATFKNEKPCMLSNFSYDAAANLEVNNKFYGVLTASTAGSTDANAYLSKAKEAIIGPHKSMLLSSYMFKDQSKIVVLNIHAINFRENSRYNQEIERFFDLIASYDGALIIAGDFNAWNKVRFKKLHENASKLNLKVVSFDNERHIKSFQGNHLDYIFYKGLELLESSVEKATQYSDHNPLFARFRKL